LNWAENYPSVIELYQTVDHPILSPKIRLSLWRVFPASFLGGFCCITWKTRHQNPPIDWEVGEGGRYACGLAHFHNGYSFLTISSNFLFLLIPSRY
jgi:hypothetical protein